VKITIHQERDRQQVIEAATSLPLGGLWTVEIKEVKSTRTLVQNDKMWGMLADVSAQVDWYGKKLTQENWKDVFSAALKRQEVVPGLDGGFVILGQSTSKMTIAEMGDMIELMTAFGIEKNVRWKETRREE